LKYLGFNISSNEII